MEIGVLLSDLAQQLRRRNPDVPDIYFSLHDAAGISSSLVHVQIAKAKSKEAGSFSENKRRKLQKLYTHGGVTYGCVRILEKNGFLTVPDVRQILHLKTSYKKLTVGMRMFKILKAFTGLKKDIWFIDMAYVDKLAKNIYGVKFLIFVKTCLIET